MIQKNGYPFYMCERDRIKYLENKKFSENKLILFYY